MATNVSPNDPVVDDSEKHSRGLIGTSVWIVVCLLVLIWWASGYRSVVEWLAEWQFDFFGRYYPSLTVALLVLLLGLPIAGAVGYARRRHRRRLDKALGENPQVLLTRVIVSARRGVLFFGGLAILTAVVALVVFVSMLWLPPTSGPVRLITTSGQAATSQGPARFARPLRMDRVARIEENVGLAQRVTYVAPVALPNQPQDLTLLTTVDATSLEPRRFAAIKEGVLVRQGLPKELTNLYRGAGIAVPDRPYLLMRDGAAVRWRPLVLGVQVALLSLLSAIVALLFRRQARRLRKIGERALY